MGDYFRDRRLFKRYRRKTDLSVTVGGVHCRASTVDFSLSGICIFIEAAPAFDLNSRLSLRIEELDIAMEADVVWVQKVESNLLVGLRKMSISGLLRHFPLADVLLDIQRSDMTGTLEMRNGGICKQIFIKAGTMVFADSNNQEDRIEEVLLRENRITGDQYYQVADLSSRTGESVGKALVDMGYIRPHDLILAVKQQAEEIILGLFQWEDGDVSFIEGPLPAGIASLKLSAANLIFHGVKRINKPEYFHAVCPPPETILYYSDEPIDLFQDIHMTEKDRYVLSLIDSKVTIREMLSLSSLGELPTMKTIWALLSTRMIVPIGKGFIPDNNIVRILKEPRGDVDSAFLARVEDIFNRLESLDYYSILGVGPKASREEVKKAFYVCAKEFHPDRHFGVSSEAVKIRLNAIFAVINDAYKILSHPAERAKYDENLAAHSSQPRTDNGETAKVKFRQGRAALEKGLYEEAAALFSQAVYYDGAAAGYHFYLGVACAKQGRLRDAAREIGAAMEIDPRNADYVAELGRVYLALGFRVRAKYTFEKAMKLDPQNRRAQEGLKSA